MKRITNKEFSYSCRKEDTLSEMIDYYLIQIVRVNIG